MGGGCGSRFVFLFSVSLFALPLVCRQRGIVLKLCLKITCKPFGRGCRLTCVHPFNAHSAQK